MDIPQGYLSKQCHCWRLVYPMLPYTAD